MAGGPVAGFLRDGPATRGRLAAPMVTAPEWLRIELSPVLPHYPRTTTMPHKQQASKRIAADVSFHFLKVTITQSGGKRYFQLLFPIFSLNW